MKKSFAGWSGIALTVFVFLFFANGCTPKDSSDPHQKESEARLKAESLRTEAIKDHQKLKAEVLASDTIVVTAIKAYVTPLEITKEAIEGGKTRTEGRFTVHVTAAENTEGEVINYWGQEIQTAQKAHKRLAVLKPEQLELTYVGKKLTLVRVKTVWKSSTKAIPGFVVWGASPMGWQM